MAQEIKGRIFKAPGPGAWELDSMHMTRPISAFAGSILAVAMKRGMSESTARYGLLLDHIEGVVVHGFWYTAARVVGAPKSASGPPPKFVLKLLCKIHPAIRRRLKTSKRVMEQRLWLEDLNTWDTIEKPALIKNHKLLQSIDPATLSDEDLIEHLVACEENVRNALYQHHRFSVANGLPIGDFIAHTSDWTGRSYAELLLLLRGYSPVSTGAAAPELNVLLDALRASGQESLLDGESAQGVLDALIQAKGDVGEAARGYIDVVGYRLVTGYDILDEYALEMPEMLVRTIRTAFEAPPPDEYQAEQASRTHETREAVPSEHREFFDQLLSDARTMYRLRDERCNYGDGWASGLARRAVLAAGVRLTERGVLPYPELLLDASVSEMTTLLQEPSESIVVTLQERADWRNIISIDDVPEWLGAKPGPPPPPEWLPPHGARAARAIGAFIKELFEDSDAESDDNTVRGVAVSPGVYEGRARFVKTSADFHKIEKGDVLLTRATSPYFNPLLPLLGAIVTEKGGSLSHAAIVAREYGIPAVVGTKIATQRIPDGARVQVNGTTGEVKLL